MTKSSKKLLPFSSKIPLCYRHNEDWASKHTLGFKIDLIKALTLCSGVLGHANHVPNWKKKKKSISIMKEIAKEYTMDEHVKRDKNMCDECVSTYLKKL